MTTTQTQPIVSAPQAYREKMFSLLGDRNPVEVLAQTPDTLADIVAEHSAPVLRTRPFEGRWTPNEVIGHLTDSEWIYGYRLRLILCEDNPNILGTNQDSWVAFLRQNEHEPSELVKSFGQCGNSIWRRADKLPRQIWIVAASTMIAVGSRWG